MSRVGKRPIPIPKGVEITFNGSEVTAKGPKGTISRSFHPDIQFNLEDGILTVSRPTDNKMHRSLHGLTRALTANMVQGVSDGFEKVLDIVGVGYRVQSAGNKIILQVGYSHPVEVFAPPGVPADRLEWLRAKFDEVVALKAFGTMGKLRWGEVAPPITGEEAAAIVDSAIALSKEDVDKFNALQDYIK